MEPKLDRSRSCDGFEPLRRLNKRPSVDERSSLHNGRIDRVGQPSRSDYGTITENHKSNDADMFEMSVSKSGGSCRSQLLDSMDETVYKMTWSRRTKNKCSQCWQYLHTKNGKTLLRNIKITILFLVTALATAVFSLPVDTKLTRHQFSVSRFETQVMNLTDVLTNTPIVEVFAVGGFLYRPPSRQTQNVTIMIENPVTGTVKAVKHAVMSHTDLQEQPHEISLTDRFDFSDEEVEDRLVMMINSSTFYSFPVEVSHVFVTTIIYYDVIFGFTVFIGMYVLIIFELMHRTMAAMVGALAALAVMAGLNLKPNIANVIGWLDYDTLCLLFGMMVTVAIFCETGFFDWLALQCYKLAKGRTWILITLLCATAGVLSALLDNVTIILLLAPVTIRLCEAANLEPRLILIAEVMFCNIGGTATAIGDPPNVLIVADSSIKDTSGGKINFSVFTLHMLVGSIFTSLGAFLLIRIMYRNVDKLKGPPSEITELKVEMEIWRRAANKIAVASNEEEMVYLLLQQKVEALETEVQMLEKDYYNSQHRKNTFEEQIEELKSKYVIKDKVLLAKSLFVLTCVIIAFFVDSFIQTFNLSIGWVAVIGALWLLVLSDHSDLDSVLHRIEWATLLFFSALFVLVRALENLHVVDWLADQASSLIQGVDESSRLAVAIIIIIWMSALISSFMDNIPFTTAMIPVVVRLANDAKLNLPIDPLIWALAFGACLGGNGTLIGASANVVCAGLAENHGYKFSFVQFFKIGFPVMLVTTFIAMCYLLICHVALDWHI